MSVIGRQAACTCQGSGWKWFTFPSHVGHGADQLWYLILAAVIVFTYIQKYIQTCCIMLSVTFKYATIHPYAWICTSFVFTCCLISAEQKNEVHRHRAGASLQNIQPQMLHLSRKTSSKQKILLRNESNSVSVSHLCCPRGINNLFGCGERSVKLKTAQMIHVSTRFFTWSLCQQTLEQRLQIRQSAESFWNWSNFRWCVY